MAIEVKSTDMVNTGNIKGLKSFSDEYSVKKLIVVSNDPYLRQIENVTILPWKIFLDQLWARDIV